MAEKCTTPDCYHQLFRSGIKYISQNIESLSDIDLRKKFREADSIYNEFKNSLNQLDFTKGLSSDDIKDISNKMDELKKTLDQYKQEVLQDYQFTPFLKKYFSDLRCQKIQNNIIFE